MTFPPEGRRDFLRRSALLALGAIAPSQLGRRLNAQSVVNLPFENGQRELRSFPQKRPLICLTTRPPQLETPFAVFNDGLITPNDAFFVRYHLAGIPTAIDPTTFRLRVHGAVKNPLELSLEELRGLADPVEVTAVNQCSGNSRGFFRPRVNGGQLGNGAMGNARWTGIPLKKVLEHAGVAKTARQVSFNGLDQPVLEATPDFVKALEIDHALEDGPLLAYRMNGEELPMLNGYPLRLVVPGYFGTYWVKHVSEIEVLSSTYTGFWMEKAYRIPVTPGHAATPAVPAAKTEPISRLTIRSFITSVLDGGHLPARRATLVRGIAFDSGQGIRALTFSADGGQSWRAATLGEELGRYSFREWKILFTPPSPGNYELLVRATNRIGETQPLEALWNSAGYQRNVVERVAIVAE